MKMTSFEAANWHHIHLTVPDTKAAAAWYASNFDGEQTITANFDTAEFGEHLVRFRAPGEGTEIDGSEGSVIDRLFFSVRDVAAKTRQLESAGAIVLAGPMKIGAGEVAFLEDPWKTKIELQSDPMHYGFHGTREGKRHHDRIGGHFL